MRSETTNTTRSPQDLGQHIQVLTHVLQGIAGSIGMARPSSMRRSSSTTICMVTGIPTWRPASRRQRI